MKTANVSPEVLRVAVLGGGRMGAGIAHAFLLAGSNVTVVERDEHACGRALKGIETLVDESIRRGADITRNVVMEALAVTADLNDVRGAHLIIEALPERLEEKIPPLVTAERLAGADTVLATNTSSISLQLLSGSLKRPERFLGLHFFNPVPASTLVEVVVGSRTSQGVIETARRWVDSLGKTPIIVSDSPGFASSRLGILLAMEAIRMLEEGVASVSDIDQAMELGYRHASGPLKTTDLVGLDVRLDIALHLERELGERFSPPRLLRDMVHRGALGRKTGQGFYDWIDGQPLQLNTKKEERDRGKNPQ